MNARTILLLALGAVVLFLLWPRTTAYTTPARYYSDGTPVPGTGQVPQAAAQLQQPDPLVAGIRAASPPVLTGNPGYTIGQTTGPAIAAASGIRHF